jgi:hypothetical protein
MSQEESQQVQEEKVDTTVPVAEQPAALESAELENREASTQQLANTAAKDETESVVEDNSTEKAQLEACDAVEIVQGGEPEEEQQPSPSRLTCFR